MSRESVRRAVAGDIRARLVSVADWMGMDCTGLSRWVVAAWLSGFAIGSAGFMIPARCKLLSRGIHNCVHFMRKGATLELSSESAVQ
jgi:hypothetical protein